MIPRPHDFLSTSIHFFNAGTADQSLYRPGPKCPPHPAFVWVLSGEMHYTSAPTGCITLRPGDLLCPLRNAHFEISGDSYRQQFVSFSGPEADRFAACCGFTVSRPVRHQAPKNIDHLMKEIILQVRENNTPNSFCFESCMFQIGRLLWNSDSPGQGTGDRTYSGQVKQLLLKHEFASLNVEQIAAELRVVPDTLRKACLRERGQTTVQYITELRLERARELLKQTPYKIFHIATASGFRSEKHFLRLFKKVHGLTPTEWRQQHRQP